MTLKDRGLATGDYIKHFKGKMYWIERVVKNADTEETMVVYAAAHYPYDRYVRSEKSFCSEVDHDRYPDCKQKYRFEKTKINET